MDEVRVRFAPSPTGYLHIGGARTALFNWLFARKYGGRFVLRIEDTDMERLKEDSAGQILSSLKWLGLDWDEGPEREGSCGPYWQSRRREVYQKSVDWLLENKKAYPCFCTAAELDAERDRQKAAGKPFRYLGACRRLSGEAVREKLAAGLRPAIRLKVPAEGEVAVDDVIHGRVVFRLDQLDDFIIFKSNGMPTYNFACAVDDGAMKISHVLRAEEHLSNTPKQMLLYGALGVTPPIFAHMPMILAPDRSKLSKRHGATSVEEFRGQGYLPEAIVNYLALLGWSPGDGQEYFTPEEAIGRFELDKMSKKAAVYDVKKLTWMNGQYLSTLPAERVLAEAMPFLRAAAGTGEEALPGGKEYLLKLVDIVRVRVKTLTELAEAARCFLCALDGYDQKGVEKYFSPQAAEYLKLCGEAVAKAEMFDVAALEGIYSGLAAQMGVKLAELIHPSRLALTGRTVSPGLFDVMVLLGRELTIKRLKAAVCYIRGCAGAP
ncbi:MAG: glutamate--tRNA ligase [Acidaminococcales bacterium]|jgi:glutamyl-tRNA synthetase|nr:glutamate--tRNA ligase [Acidaminococcales bacterium]